MAHKSDISCGNAFCLKNIASEANTGLDSSLVSEFKVPSCLLIQDWNHEPWYIVSRVIIDNDEKILPVEYIDQSLMDSIPDTSCELEIKELS